MLTPCGLFLTSSLFAFSPESTWPPTVTREDAKRTCARQVQLGAAGVAGCEAGLVGQDHGAWAFQAHHFQRLVHANQPALEALRFGRP
jgi:hypothetical protein